MRTGLDLPGPSCVCAGPSASLSVPALGKRGARQSPVTAGLRAGRLGPCFTLRGVPAAGLGQGCLWGSQISAVALTPGPAGSQAPRGAAVCHELLDGLSPAEPHQVPPAPHGWSSPWQRCSSSSEEVNTTHHFLPSSPASASLPPGQALSWAGCWSRAKGRARAGTRDSLCPRSGLCAPGTR